MTEFLVSAALVKDEEPGLCVLVPRDVVQTSGGVYEWWDDSAQRNVELPATGVFDDTMQVGLLQFGGLHDATVQELGMLLNPQLGSLLSCVYGGWYDSGIADPTSSLDSWDAWGDGDERSSLTELSTHSGRMKFVIATAHGSATNGTVGGLDAAEFGTMLDELGCEELLLLTCRGGCPGISEQLSSMLPVVT